MTTTQTYRLKIARVNSLKLKVQSKFPADVRVGNFLTLTKENGVYSFGVDYSKLTPGPISDPATAFVAIEDKTAGIYREVSLASLLTSGLDSDLQAIAALTGAGVLVRTADNTWALRTVTGTANQITVTNGDGVAGNPTLSLPSALTFTGKTVTGGSYTGATITNSTYNGNTWTAGTGTLTLGTGKTATISNTLTFTGTDGSSVAFGAGGTVVYTSNNLSVFAATTSLQLKNIISDETGSGALVFATSPTLVTPNLGTPSSVTLTNATGLPVATGVSGLGTGIATFLATPSSANLRAALTDEVGTGSAYFVGGALGTPASGVATNLTGTASGLTAGSVTTNANLTGDVTSVGNASTIAANAVTNAKLATMAAYTIKGNATGSSAVPTDISIPALTQKASPAATDKIMIADSAASNALKYATISSIASAGSVASIAGNTGAFTLSKGITNSTNDIQLALNNATLQASPTDKTGTASLSIVMLGNGSSCSITPVYSGRVLVIIQATSTNSTTANVNAQIRYGTGTAPSNGAAATGTLVGSSVASTIPGASYRVPMMLVAIITGLSPGTAYWIDLGFSVNTGTGQLLSVACSAVEF